MRTTQISKSILYFVYLSKSGHRGASLSHSLTHSLHYYLTVNITRSSSFSGKQAFIVRPSICWNVRSKGNQQHQEADDGSLNSQDVGHERRDLLGDVEQAHRCLLRCDSSGKVKQQEDPHQQETDGRTDSLSRIPVSQQSGLAIWYPCTGPGLNVICHGTLGSSDSPMGIYRSRGQQNRGRRVGLPHMIDIIGLPGVWSMREGN